MRDQGALELQNQTWRKKRARLSRAHASSHPRRLRGSSWSTHRRPASPALEGAIHHCSVNTRVPDCFPSLPQKRGPSGRLRPMGSEGKRDIKGQRLKVGTNLQLFPLASVTWRLHVQMLLERNPALDSLCEWDTDRMCSLHTRREGIAPKGVIHLYSPHHLLRQSE